ncbi:MAG: hypothetical protein AB7G48_18780 [Nitrospiraceae bacterium]
MLLLTLITRKDTMIQYPAVNDLYSLSEHLGKAIWLNNWRQGFMAAFTAYFDASGHQEDPQMPLVSVAGFIAPPDVWNDFEVKWKDRLAKDGLTVFHMSECANCEYDFQQWRAREPDRQRLLRDLLEIIKPLSRKFGCTVPLKTYRERLDLELVEQFKFKAYVLAGRACAAKVRQWCERDGAPPLSRIQFFFERGDNWQPELRERLMDDGFGEPIFKPKRDLYRNGTLVEHGLIPFQAADVLAYITFLAQKFLIQGRDDWGDKESIRWVLEELEEHSVPGSLNNFTPQNLDGINSLMRVCSIDLLGWNG